MGIEYDCAWNIEHIRGCLKSFKHLSEMHSNELRNLNGTICYVFRKNRTLGKDTSQTSNDQMIYYSKQVEKLYLLKHRVLVWMGMLCFRPKMFNAIGSM